jgi:hypothetical protein
MGVDPCGGSETKLTREVGLVVSRILKHMEAPEPTYSLEAM